MTDRLGVLFPLQWLQLRKWKHQEKNALWDDEIKIWLLATLGLKFNS